MNDDNSLLVWVIFALNLFAFTGWYSAESDNQILRKELSTYTAKEVIK